MNRLDLLKKADVSQKNQSIKIFRQNNMLGNQINQAQRQNLLTNKLSNNDDFIKNLELISQKDSTNDSFDNINYNFIDDEDLNIKLKNINISEQEMTNFIEDRSNVDYSKEDIKLELKYIIEQREEIYDLYIKTIKNGGMEISASQILHLDEVVKISVILKEIKQQVICQAKIISVFPQHISFSSSDGQYRYMVQFVGSGVAETERIITKYLLEYEIK